MNGAMNEPAFEPWNYEAVLRAFRVLTGIELRVVPNEVAKQAVMVAEHFSLRDLELVVLWTQKQIASGRGGFSNASLQWRVIMGRIGCGEDLMAFQDRLGTAEKEIARGWRPAWRLATVAKPAPRPGVRPPRPGPSEEEKARTFAKGSLAMQETMRKLQGGTRE